VVLKACNVGEGQAGPATGKGIEKHRKQVRGKGEGGARARRQPAEHQPVFDGCVQTQAVSTAKHRGHTVFQFVYLLRDHTKKDLVAGCKIRTPDIQAI
jgi:hypothetical protein